ncbi:hypothetical protein L6452_06939 [Arctium lappa]|uniref:Uncharacterized protein n=1 Tax=Arctium lappa TaxID=4217 RepID=A0ACB9EKA7_ARCLA|nr:hypothetical protein L6452_06939 [Arctium lappa]
MSNNNTNSSISNFCLKGLIEKDKLTCLNFMDWLRNLRIVLRMEKKQRAIEEPLSEAPPTGAPRATREEYEKRLTESNEAACLMLGRCGMTVKSLVGCKMAPGSSISVHVLKMKSYIDQLERLGFPFSQELATDFILNSLASSYESFIMNYNMNNMEKNIMELHGMLKTAESNMTKTKPAAPILAIREGGVKKKKPNPPKGNGKGKIGQPKTNPKPKGKGCGTHICTNVQGLKRSRKLRCGELGLIMGNKHVAPVDRIGNYELTFESGLSVDLLNKRIAKLQADGILESFDHTSYDECESCLLGKMTKAPFTGSYERGKDLLDLVHTNLTPPGTPQLNGVSERRNRTLLDMVCCMMSHTTLPISFWGYALETAAKILNLVPTKKVSKKPFEIWTGKVPSLAYLKIWGCEAYVRRESQDKLDPRSEKCYFVGYPTRSFGYLFYKPSENKVFVARRALFLERELISKEVSGSRIDLEELQESTNMESDIGTSSHQEVVQPDVNGESDIEPSPVCRSDRVRHAPERYGLLISDGDESLVDLDEPTNYQEAMAGPEYAKWKEAMETEIQSMYDNQV